MTGCTHSVPATGLRGGSSPRQSTVSFDDGPALGRPLADRITGSRLHNLKELRPGSSGTSEVRILFIFDPARNAVLLVVGGKSGQWQEWYAHAIPAAEAAYEAYVKEQQ